LLRRRRTPAYPRMGKKDKVVVKPHVKAEKPLEWTSPLLGFKAKEKRPMRWGGLTQIRRLTKKKDRTTYTHRKRKKTPEMAESVITQDEKQR